MSLRRTTLVSVLLSSLAVMATAATGCASSADEESVNCSSADSIQPFEDPGHLLGAVSRTLADNITEADIGQTFGTPDETVPYPDTYWPMTQDGINVKWNGGEASPLAKYMGMADANNLAAANAELVAKYTKMALDWNAPLPKDNPERNRATTAADNGG